MITSVNIKFEKFLHDTGRAILIRVKGKEHWIPKKLCRKLTVNKKLGGHVDIPTFFLEKMGMDVEECEPSVEIIHHIPERVNIDNIQYDTYLFR